MESDVGVDLINNSIILKKTGLNVRVVIGDEDSTTISAVRRGNPLTMFKLAGVNHLKKNFIRELYKLKSTYKEMNKKDVIPHLKKCFTYAIAQNRIAKIKN